MISSKIFELKKIKECKELLTERENGLSHPTLSNTEYLNRIYNIVESECLSNDKLKGYEVKEYFIAIAVFLYSPKSFVGEKFKIGVRDRIADVLESSPARISNIFRIVRDWIAIYKDYREGVEYLYGKVVNELATQ